MVREEVMPMTSAITIRIPVSSAKSSAQVSKLTCDNSYCPSKPYLWLESMEYDWVDHSTYILISTCGTHAYRAAYRIRFQQLQCLQRWLSASAMLSTMPICEYCRQTYNEVLRDNSDRWREQHAKTNSTDKSLSQDELPVLLTNAIRLSIILSNTRW